MGEAASVAEGEGMGVIVGEGDRVFVEVAVPLGEAGKVDVWLGGTVSDGVELGNGV